QHAAAVRSRAARDPGARRDRRRARSRRRAARRAGARRARSRAQAAGRIMTAPSDPSTSPPRGPRRRIAMPPDAPDDALSRREWLVCNGLGGYASGTIGGAPTRRYHGYLIAALANPAGRVMMLNA